MIRWAILASLMTALLGCGKTGAKVLPLGDDVTSDTKEGFSEYDEVLSSGEVENQYLNRNNPDGEGYNEIEDVGANKTGDIVNKHKGIEGPHELEVRTERNCSDMFTKQLGYNVVTLDDDVILKLIPIKTEVKNQQPMIGQSPTFRFDIMEKNKSTFTFTGGAPDGKYRGVICAASEVDQCGARDKMPLGSGTVTVKNGKMSAKRMDILFYNPAGAYHEPEYNEEAKQFGVQNFNYLCEDRQTPLTIDLQKNGYDLSSPANGVQFDLDADGNADRTAWPTSPWDALLVLDLNGNGKIDNGSELFGNHSPGPDKKKSKNGFLALAKYDEDKDGRITPKDPIFAKLQLWLDFKRDGKSEESELYPISGFGIDQINLRYTVEPKVDGYGNLLRERSTVSGSVGVMPIVDIWFLVDRNYASL